MHGNTRRGTSRPAGLAVTMAVVAATTLAATAASPGPAEGEAVPAFQAVDQNGTARDFASLTGENGLLLLFFRSADW